VEQAPVARLQIPAFSFRLEAADVEHYRRALGAGGDRIPLGMALRALTSEAVTSALRQVAAGRHPIHVAQDYRAEHPLAAGVDYVCDVQIEAVGESRLRVEQRLSDAAGRTCLTLASEIALVAS